MVLKSTTAHIFHAGDARIYRLGGSALEQFTEDHRVWLSSQQSYLSRALGMRDRLEIDYHALAITAGDTFILATDGVYEFAEPAFIAGIIGQQASALPFPPELRTRMSFDGYRINRGANLTAPA